MNTDLNLLFDGNKTGLQVGDIIEVWDPSWINGVTLNFFRKKGDGYQAMFQSHIQMQCSPEYPINVKESYHAWDIVRLIIYTHPDISGYEELPDDYKNIIGLQGL